MGIYWSDGEVTPIGVGQVRYNYNFPAQRQPLKKADWFFLREASPYDGTMILVELPKGAEVQAVGSLRFKLAKVNSGDWVKMYFLSKEQLAKKIGYEPEF